jgi:hypothetical protein
MQQGKGHRGAHNRTNPYGLRKLDPLLQKSTVPVFL